MYADQENREKDSAGNKYCTSQEGKIIYGEGGLQTELKALKNNKSFHTIQRRI